MQLLHHIEASSKLRQIINRQKSSDFTQTRRMKNIPSARRRELTTWIPGPGAIQLQKVLTNRHESALLDLASNDYLGLSRHPSLIEAAQEVMASEGVGAAGSRLVTGTRPIHRQLEYALAEWLEREYVLLFPSGFQANLAAVVALASRTTQILIDRNAHHSLLVGVKASGAKFQRYMHNDLNDLEKHLKGLKERHPSNPKLVITESLFSMEGTCAPIKEITELCRRYSAQLLIDEAHALGVLGSQGRGLCYGLEEPLAIISGTFGKAFGSGGAFLASNAQIGDLILQKSGAFKYTTALAPPLAAASLAALKLIKNNPQWGKELQKKAIKWKTQLSNQGWPQPHGEGQIISLIIGSDQEALEKQTYLENYGLLSIAIRPPTVAENTSRLRLALRRNLPNEALAQLLTALNSK